jgi:hypothetical protein
MAENLALNNHLGSGFRLRLEQHRVHVDAGRNPAGQRLQPLRPPDFPAIIGHRGIVGHVLRLERPHPQAMVRRQPAEPGNQHGLADIRPCPLKHQCPCHGAVDSTGEGRSKALLQPAILHSIYRHFTRPGFSLSNI